MGKGGGGGIGNFLGNKPWHPSTYANQKAVWIAEQKQAEEERLTRERQEELQRERDDAEMGALQSKSGGGEASSKRIDFMYAAPPGLKRDEGGGGGGGGREAPEMDAAALAFEARRVAAEEARARRRDRDGAFSAAGHSTALERETGARKHAGPSRAEQIERFPELAGAPVEGDYAKNVKLTFQPFGKQLRNVKCARCGEWGHEANDRECPLNSATNPHDLAALAAAAKKGGGGAAQPGEGDPARTPPRRGATRRPPTSRARPTTRSSASCSTGQEKGDSTSLQRGCSRSDFREKSIL